MPQLTNKYTTLLQLAADGFYPDAVAVPQARPRKMMILVVALTQVVFCLVLAFLSRG